MNKEAYTLTKTMKIIIGILGVVIVAGLVYRINMQEPIEYVAPVQEEIITQVELNKIAEAQKQLDEAKRLLDEEEDTLLAEIAERETRLEEIRKVRLSFSQAPVPAQ